MGETVKPYASILRDLWGATSVNLAVLVNKDVPTRDPSVQADFIGFHNPANEWLVGMGNGRWRAQKKHAAGTTKYGL